MVVCVFRCLSFDPSERGAGVTPNETAAQHLAVAPSQLNDIAPLETPFYPLDTHSEQ
jgi:hypothetical protein